MTRESPFHTLSDAAVEVGMEIDPSMYSESDIMTPGGDKTNYETLLLVPSMQQEVVIESSDTSALCPQEVVIDDSTREQELMNQSALFENLEPIEDSSQEVIEEMVELELDVETLENSHGLIESGMQDNQKVYTELSSSGTWDAMTTMITSCQQQEEEAVIQTPSYHRNDSYTSSISALQVFPEEDSSDLLSWTQKHPESWTSKELLDWIYYLPSSTTSIDSTLLKGEAFRNIDGATLCRWTEQDFIAADSLHGRHLYEEFKRLMGDAEFYAPEEDSDQLGLEHQPCVNPVFNQSDHGISPLCTDIESLLPSSTNTEYQLAQSAVARSMLTRSSMTRSIMTPSPVHVSIDGQSYPVDLQDRFDDITPSLVRELAMSAAKESQSTCNGSITSHTNSSTNHQPVKRGRGRPRKNPRVEDMEDGSDGEYKPKRSKPMKKSGKKKENVNKRNKPNNMFHLWEFLRDMLLDSDKLELIRWLNRRQGVFEVLKTAQVAKLWGVIKKKPDMTFENFSRSIRFGRTAGYFTDIPSPSNYPKKRVYAFDAKNTSGWQL